MFCNLPSKIKPWIMFKFPKIRILIYDTPNLFSSFLCLQLLQIFVLIVALNNPSLKSKIGPLHHVLKAKPYLLLFS